MGRAFESTAVYGPTSASRRPGPRPIALALWFLLAALLPARASALARSFILETGSALAVASGAELGGVPGLYGLGTAFPVELTPLTGANGFAAEVGSFFIPVIELPFGGDLFSFEILDQGVPTDAFTLTLAMPGGEFNPALTDPALEVRMFRTFDGVPAGTGNFSLPLTTGQLQTSQCGSVPPTAISGSPLDLATGAVELVGAACIQQFAGAPFGALFRIRLIGTLALAAPVPALSPWGLLALASTTACLGISRLRAGAASARLAPERTA